MCGYVHYANGDEMCSAMRCQVKLCFFFNFNMIIWLDVGYCEFECKIYCVCYGII